MEEERFAIDGINALKDLLKENQDNYLSIDKAEQWLDQNEPLFHEHINIVFDEVNLKIEPWLYEYTSPEVPAVFAGLVFPELYYTLKFYSHVNQLKNTLDQLRRHFIQLDSPIETKYIKSVIYQSKILRKAIDEIEINTKFFKKDQIEIFEFNPEFHTPDFPLTYVYLQAEGMESALAFAKLFYRHIETPYYGIFEQQMVLQ